MPDYNFKYSYQQFPKWQDEAEGMEIIQADNRYTRIYIIPDIIYAVKDGIKLRMRMVIPETADNKPFPLIMHVKGSGWDVQNLSGNIGDFTRLVENGYGVAIVQYRNSSQAKYPAQVEDLKSAARYISSHHEELNVDLSNLFLSGDSSGGHTAVMGYLTWNTPQLDDCSETAALPKLRGLIDYYGVTSIRDLCSRETGLSREDNALLPGMIFDENISLEQQY
ncbi:MAG: alpha/beta hydrolase, partial [Erysipelotrichaceae bacterium]|nr:alpha/beta hydrolase [Erysipelotrichaceae bacterium]